MGADAPRLFRALKSVDFVRGERPVHDANRHRLRRSGAARPPCAPERNSQRCVVGSEPHAHQGHPVRGVRLGRRPGHHGGQAPAPRELPLGRQRGMDQPHLRARDERRAALQELRGVRRRSCGPTRRSPTSSTRRACCAPTGSPGSTRRPVASSCTTRTSCCGATIRCPTSRSPSCSPVSSPELAEKYPLVLTTGARVLRVLPFRASPGGHDVARAAPRPAVRDAALTRRRGRGPLRDGDWAWIENHARPLPPEGCT